MYNGIGLTTPRGTGTSGYVQANLSNLHFSKNRTDYNTEAEIAKAEAEINREPNAELLDHEFKRAIEIKCVEFEDLMEGKGFSEEEIRAKVDEYRQLLYTDLESGRQEMIDKGELDLRNSHSRAKVAKDARDRFRMAVGIDAAFVDGSSLEKIRKAAEAAKMASDSTADADTKNKEEMEKSLMEKVMDRLKKAKETKKRKRDQSSSSSDSSSDSDSSSTTSSSSSSTDSEEERRRRRVKGKEQEHKKQHSTRQAGKKESPPKFKVPKQELESVRSERPPADSRESTRRGTSVRDEPRSRGREDREGREGDIRRHRGSNEEARNASPPRHFRRDERSKSRERRPDGDEERDGRGVDTRRRRGSNEEARNASPPLRHRRVERSRSRDRRPDSDEEREERRRRRR